MIELAAIFLDGTSYGEQVDFLKSVISKVNFREKNALGFYELILNSIDCLRNSLYLKKKLRIFAHIYWQILRADVRI